MKDGILLLNKPQGITSNLALQKAKRLFEIKKAGHTGSLDPLATGMLPLCFGEATKISQYLLDADKCYETTGLLGIKTNTADSTGEIVSQVQDYDISEEQLLAAIHLYQGTTQQVPSMFSALKHKGMPLYHYARKGIEIDRPAREIVISQLQLDAYDGANFSLTVSCSKGTYIRNLVEDIGDTLHTGAHVTRLHRLYVAGFKEMPMYTLEQLNEMSLAERLDCLIPMDRPIEYLEALTLTDEEVLAIRQGRIIARDLKENLGLYLRLYDAQGLFIGLGEQQEAGIKAKRLIAF